jgi:hypothetical protein
MSRDRRAVRIVGLEEIEDRRPDQIVRPQIERLEIGPENEQPPEITIGRPDHARERLEQPL